MGSYVSSNDMDRPSSTSTNSASSSSTDNRIFSNDSRANENTSDNSHVYVNDQFRLEFLDCNCCCDTTKKVANCDFQGINILQDLYELVDTPEYKLNCRCVCGDDIGEKKQSMKFGLTASPNAHMTCDGLDLSCPTSSDSKMKR